MDIENSMAMTMTNFTTKLVRLRQSDTFIVIWLLALSSQLVVIVAVAACVNIIVDGNWPHKK